MIDYVEREREIDRQTDTAHAMNAYVQFGVTVRGLCSVGVLELIYHVSWGVYLLPYKGSIDHISPNLQPPYLLYRTINYILIIVVRLLHMFMLFGPINQPRGSKYLIRMAFGRQTGV